MDKYLGKLLPNAGTSFLYKMLRKKNITLNDHKAGGNEILIDGDSVKLWLSEDTIETFVGRRTKVYDDVKSLDSELHKSLTGMHNTEILSTKERDISRIIEISQIARIGVLNQNIDANTQITSSMLSKISH